jgi:hypothetical protein
LARQIALTGEHDTYRNERTAIARWLGQGWGRKDTIGIWWSYWSCGHCPQPTRWH